MADNYKPYVYLAYGFVLGLPLGGLVVEVVRFVQMWR